MDKEIRLGRFDKWGYKNSFSKGELAKELTYMNRDYDKLQQENKQLKEIIKENTILVKDEYGDYQECNINPLEMKQKYEKQVDNWNKLKEYLTNLIPTDKTVLTKYIKIFEVLNRMQELEQGSDSDE